MKQLFYSHEEAPVCALDEGALTGLRHRTVIDKRTGAEALALWQEEHLPGFYVPPHIHDCEEIITVLEGEIEGFVKDTKFTVGKEQSFLIPAWELHGFRVISEVPVKLLALFSSASPKIYREDGSLSNPPWEGGHSNHLSGTTH